MTTENPLASVRIVLVQTYHPGNIGATARAMKNMGLRNLVLVNPVDFPSDVATARASGAEDILQQARIVSSLSEAIADCTLVVGASARSRTIDLPEWDAAVCARNVVAAAQQGVAAIVFGRERMGLHNVDIQQCHKQVIIDADPTYASLNIAQAVQIVCYELYRASMQDFAEVADQADYPLHEQLQHFYELLAQWTQASDYVSSQEVDNVMQHIRAFIRRGEPTQRELNLLFGLVQSSLGKLRD